MGVWDPGDWEEQPRKRPFPWAMLLVVAIIFLVVADIVLEVTSK